MTNLFFSYVISSIYIFNKLQNYYWYAQLCTI